MRAPILPLAICLFVHSVVAQIPCRMEISISGAAGDTIYLANYYGNRLFYSDTAVADAQGLAVFARKSGYKPGLYAVLPGTGRLEIVVNEPLIRLATEAKDAAGSVRVLESRENKVYLVDRKAAAALPGPERDARLMKLARANPGTLAATLILLELEPAKVEVHGPDGTLDSAATADRHRDHYWDNTDLTDDRIAHAPAFQNRLEALLAVGLPQKSEPLVAYLDSLIGRAGKAEEVKHLIVSLATRKYADQPTQGLGAVFVRMAQRYVCTGPAGAPGAEWKPADQWNTTCEKAARKSTLLAGAKTRDLVLADSTGQNWISMHAMPQSCVVVVFWSPHCVHCKQSIPMLYEKYVNELKPLDVGVYAVGDSRDTSLFNDWKAFIHEKSLNWVNVGVPWDVYSAWKLDPTFQTSHTTVESLDYAETWEVFATPQFYVLDKERRVLAKPTSISEIVKVVKAYEGKAQ